ncbi:phosphate signaling complex protein PhoU [Lentilactobacillus sp. SPB1-3]|uniref:Phosphate signaling complex protein PhoU n=1 Tax=Lentilactobacillus terminaliae TaxID=3003483 RepID=A0ACD5DGY0_9LACO|nr:phosphate signaling complex protein PhoU [Lentilactobacillus sp. SPB1-3]MCZ0976949.1 phosphate signaling complex protein PhoU [Lentilactobacillus sp. SPB1-3]
MGKIFDEELTALKADFMKMAALVRDAVANSGQAFIDHDVDAANAVIDHDHEINELQTYLEKRSFELIALYQPVTTDLREVVGVLKSVTDLERAGDHARNIARSTVKIKGQDRIPEVEKVIATMVNEVVKEYSQSIDAYVAVDDSRAKETASIFNEEINGLYNGVASPSYRTMTEKPDILNSAIIYLNVAKDLSRISDYSTNICEWTVYLATGKIIELG